MELLWDRIEGKWECGLLPVGAIGVYAPEGMRKLEKGMRICLWPLLNTQCALRAL